MPAFSNPSAILPGEADILANVLAHLSDYTAKLVYADWLEDRDDPRGPLLREFVNAYLAGRTLPDVTSAPEPWCDLVGITLIDKSQESLARHTNTLLRLARPALRLDISPEPIREDEIPVGSSKVGGSPDMPQDVEWPVWEILGERRSHTFHVQINLADIASSPVARELPSSGLLSFFQEDAATLRDCTGGWRVFHFRDPSQLFRREPPVDLDAWKRETTHSIAFTEMLTLPDSDDSPYSQELGLNGEEKDDTYSALSSEYFQSHLLGYPRQIHYRVEEGKEDRLLLQLATGHIWYFRIKEDDLRQQRFDRVGFDWER